MKKTLCVSTLLCLAGQPLVAQERPNVIVFLVDDMGLMDTSLPFLTDEAGNPVRYPLNDWYQTPNMERMARQGIRFSTFYAQSVSSPRPDIERPTGSILKQITKHLSGRQTGTGKVSRRMM